MTTTPAGTRCLFCRIAADEIPAEKVYEDDEIVAFKDINAQAPLHQLIIPRIHIPTLNDLLPEHTGILGRMLFVAQRLAVEQGLSDSGYRLVINCNRDGGQSVFHIHLHMLGGRRLGWPPG